MNEDLPHQPLLSGIKSLIEASRQQMAVAVNAAMSMLYWQVGKQINQDVLQNTRAGYGEQIVQILSRQLSTEYGQGWSAKQLRHCMKFAEVYPDLQIVSTLWRQLSWSHLKEVMYMDDPLKRDFYIEICKLEKWSVRTFRTHTIDALRANGHQQKAGTDHPARYRAAEKRAKT